MHLERLALILEIVGQKGEATVADICSHSDLPKPTTYRLVQDLVGAGLLEPMAKGRFSIGTRLRRIAQADQSDDALIALIGPALRQAATLHGVAFFLSRLRSRSFMSKPPTQACPFCIPALANGHCTPAHAPRPSRPFLRICI